MKKKIVCVIMSAVMSLGLLTSCGGKNDIEPTILTELTAGESTTNDLEEFFEEHNIEWEEKEFEGNTWYYSSGEAGKFLGYEYERINVQFVREDKKKKFKEDTVKSLSFRMIFKNADEYNKAVEEVDDYLKELSDGVVLQDTDESDSSERDLETKYYLVNDEDDFFVGCDCSHFDHLERDGYYNKTISISVFYTYAGNVKGLKTRWVDSDGEPYTPKSLRD